VDLAFVPKVHKVVQMGLKGIDESVFPIIAPRLLGARGASGPSIPSTAIYTIGSKSEGLVGFGMTGIHTGLDCLDTGIFTAEMCAIHFACNSIESNPLGAYIILTDSFASIEGLKSTRISFLSNEWKSLRYLGGTWI
jgi:hypothetical protein